MTFRAVVLTSRQWSGRCKVKLPALVAWFVLLLELELLFCPTRKTTSGLSLTASQFLIINLKKIPSHLEDQKITENVILV